MNYIVCPGCGTRGTYLRPHGLVRNKQADGTYEFKCCGGRFALPATVKFPPPAAVRAYEPTDREIYATVSEGDTRNEHDRSL